MKTKEPRLLLLKSHVAAYTRKDGTFVAAHDDKRSAHARLPSDDPKAVAKQSLSAESAAHVRADRIVASKANPADKARERGFRDAMMGLPSRRDGFSKISQVSYDQGVERAKKMRETLKGRPWMETELERDGSKWRWAVYEEGKHIASGEAKTEKAAGQAVDDARVRAAEKRAAAK